MDNVTILQDMKQLLDGCDNNCLCDISDVIDMFNNNEMKPRDLLVYIGRYMKTYEDRRNKLFSDNDVW